MTLHPDHEKLKIKRDVVGKGYAHDSARRHVRGRLSTLMICQTLPGTLAHCANSFPGFSWRTERR